MAESIRGPERDLGALLGRWSDGEAEAVDRFFRRRPERLALVARLNRGRRIDPAIGAPEDIVQDAWVKLCEGAGEGQLDRVETLGDLWHLYRAVLRCRVLTHRRDLKALKRGGAGRGGSAPDDQPSAGWSPSARVTAVEDLDQLPSGAAPPEARLLAQEQVERLLDLLGDPCLREIALRRGEGDTGAEIARALGLALRTVERKLAVIRALLATVAGARADGAGPTERLGTGAAERPWGG